MKTSLILLAATALLSSSVSAEKMAFTYTLNPLMNICFLQNIAENIQGKHSKDPSDLGE